MHHFAVPAEQFARGTPATSLFDAWAASVRRVCVMFSIENDEK